MDGMYGRFARDLSNGLFDSIYSSLQRLAACEQEAIYAACKKHRKGRAPEDYRIGDAQRGFDDFCHNRLSLGHAMDAISLAKAYEEPL